MARVIAIVWFLLIGGSLPVAADTVNAALDTPSIDLLPHLQAVTTDQPAVSIEVPASAAGQTILLPLEAKGFGPSYRWIVASLANPSSASAGRRHARPASGLCRLGRFLAASRRAAAFVSLVSVGGAQPASLADAGADAFALRIEPGQTMTVALEIDLERCLGHAAVAAASLRGQFQASRSFAASFSASPFLSASSRFRSTPCSISAVFPAAALFIWASIGFIALEAGYFPRSRAWLAGLGARRPGNPRHHRKPDADGPHFVPGHLRRIAQAQARRGQSCARFACLTLALPVYGWFEPSTRRARPFCIRRRRRRGLRHHHSPVARRLCPRPSLALTWAALVVWTSWRRSRCLSPEDDMVLKMLVQAGLALVLLMMGFTLAQFAFSHGILSRRSSEDAMRRSGARRLAAIRLGLEGSIRNLHVGEELERTLGLQRGYLAQGGQQAWLALIHPADRRAYLATIETAERRGRGGFTQEFRLQRADGTYRWFQLRGRAMPGVDRTALHLRRHAERHHQRAPPQDRLLSDAVHDRVTGLPNRALLVDRIARAMAKSGAPEAGDFYLLIIDLDRFKAVNDGLGPRNRRRLLKIIGRRLLATASPRTLWRACRAISSPSSSQCRHAARSGCLRQDVRRAVSVPIRLREQEIFLTASIGIAVSRERVRRPRICCAMRRSHFMKRSGAARTALNSSAPTMRDDRNELVTLESDLRRAVERGEIEVHYQPIARLADMELAGFEALVRWRHPSLGLLGRSGFSRLPNRPA